MLKDKKFTYAPKKWDVRKDAAYVHFCSNETIGGVEYHSVPQSPVPIYEQIVSQIIFTIAADGLEPGSLIPSVRELAQRLLVHPNTVARAFQELERRGVVTAKRGVGMEVTPEARKLCRDERQEIVRTQIREALRAAVAIDPTITALFPSNRLSSARCCDSWAVKF